jgi:hypothetical protein
VGWMPEKTTSERGGGDVAELQRLLAETNRRVAEPNRGKRDIVFGGNEE